MIKTLEKQGHKKEKYNICLLFNRKVIGANEKVNDNLYFVDKRSKLFIYYKSNLPFYSLNSNEKERYCPLCRMTTNYMTDYNTLYLYKDIRNHVEGIQSLLPPIKEAPLKDKAINEN